MPTDAGTPWLGGCRERNFCLDAEVRESAGVIDLSRSPGPCIQL